ncbi:unnamed protein product [Nippostrongylus brasiliensis]|uniref:Pentatricopeptide repeat-containing protein n=1 Tax=Nippostrongylus brasiliensis TaxID=27835 RepID=A0A0N4XY67_NIPBR|nr:unnamed protein product [Nippostrongylus brasiliensis]
MALQCLQPLIPFFSNTPLIWVRILEIGIRLLYYSDNVSEGEIVSVCGSGRTRKVVLAPKSSSLPGKPSAKFYAQIAQKAGITEDYLESIAGLLLSLTRKTANRKLRLTCLSLATYVALKLGRYYYATDLAQKMIAEEQSIGDFSSVASMYLMECKMSTDPFDTVLEAINADEKQVNGSIPTWSRINRCIVLCANRRYADAEVLYKELRTCMEGSELYRRTILALGIFVYSKQSRASEVYQLIHELIHDDAEHAQNEPRSTGVEDPAKILARIEAERRPSLI